MIVIADSNIFYSALIAPNGEIATILKDKNMQFIIVTGLSGAGKSNAIKYLEDMGYYCIDNMPPMLMADFINLVQSS